MVNTLLSSKVTVGDYLNMLDSGDKARIAEFVQQRFTERYFDSVRHNHENGFALMAVSCLMIEALRSFQEGWPNTNGISAKAFHSYFSANINFNFMHGYEDCFYKHVRCGILHQAETTGGWKIKRVGKIFDPKTKIINAKKFHGEVEISLLTYCNQLRVSDSNDVAWINFRIKMDSILKNCRAKQG